MCIVFRIISVRLDNKERTWDSVYDKLRDKCPLKKKKGKKNAPMMEIFKV